MKKLLRITAVALLAAVSLPAFAATKNKPKDPGQIGVRVAYDLTGPNHSYGFIKYGSGVSVGAGYTTYLAPRFYFNPSVLFCYNTMKYDGPLEQKRHADIKGTLTDFGAALPFDFGFNFVNAPKVKVSVFTGPRVQFNFSLHDKYDFLYHEGSVRHHEHAMISSGVELCWSAGLAIDLLHHWRVQAGYIVGLTRMCDTEELMLEHVDLKRLQLSVSLGYNF